MAAAESRTTAAIPRLSSAMSAEVEHRAAGRAQRRPVAQGQGRVAVWRR